MARMPWLEPVFLSATHASLEPLQAEHRDALCAAVEDGELWNRWYTSIPRPEGMGAEIERRLQLQAQGSMLPFVIRERRSGQIAGLTSYMHVDAVNRRLEIGSTWYRHSVQRTPLNTESKLLLLRHAFETLDCIAVEFRTHFFNQQSRHAIERLGAKLDGILRSHQRLADGSLRDTCVYSIVAAEWPAVKAHLSWQLARPRV